MTHASPFYATAFMVDGATSIDTHLRKTLDSVVAEVEDLDADRHSRVGRSGQGRNTPTAAVQRVDRLVDGALKAGDAPVQHLQLWGCGADGHRSSASGDVDDQQSGEEHKPEADGRHVGGRCSQIDQSTSNESLGGRCGSGQGRKQQPISSFAL